MFKVIRKFDASCYQVYFLIVYFRGAMCWYLKDAKTIEELYLQIAVLDISIQALIK